MNKKQYSPEIEALVTAWQAYADQLTDWHKAVEGVTPKQTPFGPIYEPASPLALDRPNESFAIADMRQIKLVAPHYHTNGEIEIYFILSGTGLTVVGGKEILLAKGVVIVTPPETTHFTIPENDLVIMAINTPPFRPENCVMLDASDPRVRFDEEQLKRLMP
jgi:mannose-6-phosphate isomerase-like protein (cupin superfamily)